MITRIAKTVGKAVLSVGFGIVVLAGANTLSEIALDKYRDGKKKRKERKEKKTAEKLEQLKQKIEEVEPEKMKNAKDVTPKEEGESEE